MMLQFTNAFNDKTVQNLPIIINPGMITDEEEKLYFYIAKNYFTPNRKYLEIGPWLGRSTQRICQGLTEADNSKTWELICYDKFLWTKEHAKKTKNHKAEFLVKNLNPGNSFRDVFLQMMGRYSRNIKACCGDVINIKNRLFCELVPTDKIGILFVDASKNWEDNTEMLRFLAQYFVVDKQASIILFQDFFFLT